MLTARTRAWLEGGELVATDGGRVFVRHRSGEGQPLLLLHGYPSSSYDWRAVLESLPARQAACFDFLGFGLSEKPRDHVYSLHAQADLVEAIVARCGADAVTLIAHDMATSVVNELMARDLERRLPFTIAGVLLFNGSMVLERASLTISQKVLRSRLGPLAARLSNQRAFRAQFARIFSTAHPLTAEEAADQWSLLANRDGHRLLHKLTYYLHERVAFATRWHGALRDWDGRLELAWAGADPVCTEAVLQAVLELRPGAPLTRLPELGHYPQVEDPSAVARIIDRFAPPV